MTTPLPPVAAPIPSPARPRFSSCCDLRSVCCSPLGIAAWIMGNNELRASTGRRPVETGGRQRGKIADLVWLCSGSQSSFSATGASASPLWRFGNGFGF